MKWSASDRPTWKQDFRDFKRPTRYVAVYANIILDMLSDLVVFLMPSWHVSA
jgi:hypothetical protein